MDSRRTKRRSLRLRGSLPEDEKEGERGHVVDATDAKGTADAAGASVGRKRARGSVSSDGAQPNGAPAAKKKRLNDARHGKNAQVVEEEDIGIFAGVFLLLLGKATATQTRVRVLVESGGGQVKDLSTIIKTEAPRGKFLLFEEGAEYGKAQLEAAAAGGCRVVRESFFRHSTNRGRLMTMQEYGLGVNLLDEMARANGKDANLAFSYLPPAELELAVPKERTVTAYHQPQTYEEFISAEESVVASGKRRNIYFLPTAWTKNMTVVGVSVNTLVHVEKVILDFLQAFFETERKTFAERSIILDRSNPSGRIEYCLRWGSYLYPIGWSTIHDTSILTPPAHGGKIDRISADDVLDIAIDQEFPDDTMAVLAMTIHDIYVDRRDETPLWGHANTEGASIVSALRFLPQHVSVSRQFREVAQAAAVSGQGPATCRRSARGHKAKEPGPTTVGGVGCKEMARLLQLTAHYGCKMLGMRECQFYRCLMNPVPESDTGLDGNLFLCPICLRKLQFAMQLDDLRTRYEALEQLYRQLGLTKEAEWMETLMKRASRAAMDAVMDTA